MFALYVGLAVAVLLIVLANIRTNTNNVSFDGNL